MQELTFLGLSDPRITNVGLKEVAKLQNLEWLALMSTKTLRESQGLGLLQNLKTLFLSDNKTAATSRRWPRCSKLKLLQVVSSQNAGVR